MITRKMNVRLLIVVLATIGLASCQKENLLSEFISSEEESQSTEAAKTIVDDVDAVSFKGTGSPAGLPSCATITESFPNGTPYPMVVTIDYGNGCTTNKNVVKKGKVIVTFSDDFRNTGATRTVAYDGFYINDKQVEGTRTATNDGPNADGNIVISHSSNTTLTKADGTVFSRTSTGWREWIAGFATWEDRTDDVFLQSGNGSMTSSDGKSGSRTITTPLLIDNSCDYILSGVVEMVRNGNTIIMDFGNGTCDNLATVTKDGTTYEIELDKHRVKGRK